jgi:hypothetical protein
MGGAMGLLSPPPEFTDGKPAQPRACHELLTWYKKLGLVMYFYRLF